MLDDDEFAVLKILATQQAGVHVRVYAQRFDSRPSAHELPPLTTGPIDHCVGSSVLDRHMPLRHSRFAAWQPLRICGGPVADDELEGYRMSVETEGGSF